MSFTSLLLNSEPSTSKKQKLTPGREEPPLTNAIRSFPDEVQLCLSSLPGAIYGVCAKEHIPLGTWIGPYEGRRIPPQHNTPDIDSSYLWEVGFVGVLISQMPRKKLHIAHLSTRSWPKIRYFKTVSCTSTSGNLHHSDFKRGIFSLGDFFETYAFFQLDFTAHCFLNLPGNFTFHPLVKTDAGRLTQEWTDFINLTPKSATYSKVE